MWQAWLLMGLLAGPEVQEPVYRPPERVPQMTPPEGLRDRARPLTPRENIEVDRLRTLGIRAYGAGDYRTAAEYFRQALKIDPNDRLTQAWLRAAESRGG